MPFRKRSHLLDDVLCELGETRRLQLELHGPRVVPTDLQQVGQQRVEPLHLRVQELGGTGGRGVELVALVVEHVGGEADRRQRGPELVRDVGHEALLHHGELAELLDLRLDAVGHGIEGAPQRRELVLAVHLQPHAEIARREPRTRLGRLDDRGGHGPQHDPGDGRDDGHQPDAGDPEGALHEHEGLVGVGEVVGEVDLEGPGLRHLELLPHDDARHDAAVLRGQGDGLPGLPVVELADPGLQLGAQQIRREPGGEAVEPDRPRAVLDLEAGEQVGARRAREGVGDAVPQIGERGGVIAHLRHVQQGLRLVHRSAGILQRDVLPRHEEVVLDDQRHRDARDEDRQRRGDEGDREGGTGVSAATAPPARPASRASRGGRRRPWSQSSRPWGP